MSRTLTYQQIRQAIIASLSSDLLEPKYRKQLAPGDPAETGHCAIATEAFYHLAGGRHAGLMPVVCGYHEDTKGQMYFDAVSKRAHPDHPTHWWIRGPQNSQRGKGHVFDVTVGQYAAPFPYEHGRNVGFMQPQQKPSRRAQIVIDRVTKILGKEALAAFKAENIRRFQAQAQKRASTDKRPLSRALKI